MIVQGIIPFHGSLRFPGRRDQDWPHAIGALGIALVDQQERAILPPRVHRQTASSRARRRVLYAGGSSLNIPVGVGYRPQLTAVVTEAGAPGITARSQLHPDSLRSTWSSANQRFCRAVSRTISCCGGRSIKLPPARTLMEERGIRGASTMITERALWVMERNSAGPLTLNGIAAACGVSRSHLANAFGTATGWPVMKYLKARRMTEAARQLASGAPDILTVALDHGYGSHQAFTRAFKDQFGLSPEQVRARGTVEDLATNSPLKLSAGSRRSLEPRLERLEAMMFTGLAAPCSYNDTIHIPAQWQRFSPYVCHVQGVVDTDTYGIAGAYFPEDGSTEYMCGVQLQPSAELPPEFREIVIPAQRYARLTHRGHVSTIFSTIDAIFREWLPSSGYRKKQAPYSYIEHYDEAFNPLTGLGSLDIWIALED